MGMSDLVLSDPLGHSNLATSVRLVLGLEIMFLR